MILIGRLILRLWLIDMLRLMHLLRLMYLLRFLYLGLREEGVLVRVQVQPEIIFMVND
jgi:hypothetical protein